MEENMALIGEILNILDVEMNVPTPYGWFHILSLLITLFATLVVCIFCKNRTRRQVITTVFVTAILVTLFEIYKQVNYTFSYDGQSISANFQWYAFPFQFCSTPMYVGLLAGIIRKGKVHESLCAYLATYSIFAGICVMLYPVTVFIDTVGINIQTMFCHGSMIVIGVYLLATGYVKLEHKTILKAIPVFAIGVTIATVMNEVAYYTGLLENYDFNMFFISRHAAPSLPVYSLVQGVAPFPFCLILYVGGFTLASYLILLVAMGIRVLVKKYAVELKKAPVFPLF